MVIKAILTVLFTMPLLASADTLLQGAVYFDSRATLVEVKELSAASDNTGISRLLANRHVSAPTPEAREIDVLETGPNSDSPAEFRFTDSPTTWWTMMKFVEIVVVTPSPTPVPTPTPTPPTPLTQTEDQIFLAKPTPVIRHRAVEKPPYDDDNGEKIWHQVNGEWKWYWKNGKPPKRERHRVESTVRKALPITQPTPSQ